MAGVLLCRRSDGIWCADPGTGRVAYDGDESTHLRALGKLMDSFFVDKRAQLQCCCTLNATSLPTCKSCVLCRISVQSSWERRVRRQKPARYQRHHLVPSGLKNVSMRIYLCRTGRGRHEADARSGTRGSGSSDKGGGGVSRGRRWEQLED